jgi:adenylate cyclase
VATVLFTDLRDFTSISEGFEAQELLDWLNEYMETMATMVDEHQGVIDKFIGDAIMAVFGIPVPRRSSEEIAADARRALDCALAMSASLERLNARWTAEGRPTVRMRVGIFTGELVAGNLGSKQRMNYTVIGDTVNTASRLESYNKDVGADRTCRIIAGAPTLALVSGEYAVEPVGKVELKGKSQPVEVYLVNGRQTATLGISRIMEPQHGSSPRATTSRPRAAGFHVDRTASLSAAEQRRGGADRLTGAAQSKALDHRRRHTDDG